MKILLWITGTIFALFIAGQIFITNENLANFLYFVLFYGLAIFGIIFGIFVLYKITFGFGLDTRGDKFNTFGKIFGFISIGVIIFLFFLFGSDFYKININNFANYLSNHVEIKKGKMPIFNIGNPPEIKTVVSTGGLDLKVNYNN